MYTAASPISSNQALQVAHITSITSSIPICPEARQSCHSHHHGLSRRDVFLAKRNSVVMHSWNVLHAAVHPTSRLTFPVVNSRVSPCQSVHNLYFPESQFSTLDHAAILSTIYRVWTFISSRTSQTEPYLSGQETFRRAFTDSKPGRPILRLSTSQVLQEFVHQATGSFW